MNCSFKTDLTKVNSLNTLYYFEVYYNSTTKATEIKCIGEFELSAALQVGGLKLHQRKVLL